MQLVSGDLLSVETGIIAHGVNCCGVMGSGVAKQIRAKYPAVFDRYQEFVKQLGISALGNINGLSVSPTLRVFNCYTQINYGSLPVISRYGCHLDYAALENSLWLLAQFTVQYNHEVYIPKIGCGLAGGDWKRVEEILKKIEKYHSGSEKNFEFVVMVPLNS